MWTCDVATKLADFKILSTPWNEALLREKSRSFHDEESQGFSFAASDYRHEYVYQLVGSLSPSELFRNLSREAGQILYFGRFFEWREVLLYLSPDLEAFMAFHELKYRLVCSWFMAICDFPHSQSQRTSKTDVILALIYLLELEIPRLKRQKELDSLPADHLEAILHNRLKILCLIVFDPVKSDAIHDAEIFVLGSIIAHSNKLSSCIPPGPWHSDTYLERLGTFSPKPTVSRRHNTSYRLSSPGTSEQINDSHTDVCICCS